MEPIKTLDEMVQKKLQELTARLDRIEAQAADPDELVFGIRKTKSLFRVRMPKAVHRPEAAGAESAMIPLPVADVGDALVYCMIDEIDDAAGWIAKVLAPRASGRITLEVLR